MLGKITKSKSLLLLALVLIMTVMLVMLAGCADDSDESITLTLTLKNRTEYEFQKILFIGSNTTGRGNPYVYYNIVDTEAEYRENYFYNSEEGTFYSGYDAESIEPLSAGDEIQFKLHVSEKVLREGWGVEFETSNAKYTSRFDLSEETQDLIITYEEETGIVFLPFYQNSESGDLKNTETAAPLAPKNTEPDASPAPYGYFTLTIFADFPGEIREKKSDPLPIENEPHSLSLIAFCLAKELSEWTGFDFTLNDVSFGEDSVTVDWSKDSTLIAGLDDRNQKEDFRFFDGVTLNWFMMDSLAMTLKNNFDVTTVYYCSDGGSVTFSNWEDMADQGLPELPADQPYEGSTFFINHTGVYGDWIPIDRNQAEVIVKEATKADALDIETKGGKADYVYIGEGEIGNCNAWYFNLVGDANEYRFAVNERGELWGMDTFGKWQFLPLE